jgi:hypothetical protein
MHSDEDKARDNRYGTVAVCECLCENVAPIQET